MAQRARRAKPRKARPPFVRVVAPPPPPPPKNVKSGASFSRHLRKALELLAAAPNNPSADVGYRLLISGYEQLMLAGCMADTPEELFLVGKGRKVGFQASRKLLVKLRAPKKKR